MLSDEPVTGFLLLVCDGFGNLPREDAEFFRFSARIFLEITLIDIRIVITVYKKVIIIPNRKAFCDFGLFIVA